MNKTPEQIQEEEVRNKLPHVEKVETKVKITQKGEKILLTFHSTGSIFGKDGMDKKYNFTTLELLSIIKFSEDF